MNLALGVLGEPNGMGSYLFCNNNPVVWTDPEGLRNLLAAMTSIQLATPGKPTFSEDEIKLVGRLFQRYKQDQSAVWEDYQSRSGVDRFMSHVSNTHNNLHLGVELLLIHSLQEGVYAKALPKGQQAMLILDSVTRELLFTSLAKMAATSSAILTQGPTGALTMSPSMASGTGKTCTVTGKMVVSSNGTLADTLQATLHEGVHSALTPVRGSFLQTARASLRAKLYQGSHLLRFTEEALAETAAQLGTRNLTGMSIRQGLSAGLRFPISHGYGLHTGRILMEATGLGLGCYVGYEGLTSVESLLTIDSNEAMNIEAGAVYSGYKVGGNEK